jgi:hypothetical protein
MCTAFDAKIDFDRFILGAKAAVEAAPTQATVWAIAEYLDLVEAKEVPSNAKLVRECTQVINRFVMANLTNDAYVPFWESAGCLMRGYKRALKAAERVINAEAALLA